MDNIALIRSGTSEQLLSFHESGFVNWGKQFLWMLGDVRVWNRPLSAAEVMQVYLADPH